MIINQKPLIGEIGAIPSKSDAHRAIICALLSRRSCKISPIILSKDITATINAAKALGACCRIDNDTLYISPSASMSGGKITIDCFESGSTLRFMLAVAAALGANADFVGSGRLPQRPITEYYKLFGAHGANMSSDRIPLRLSGGLTCGEYKISGNVSSQFISGLLMALPVLQGESKITLTTKLQSKPYVDMTISTMKKFGVEVIENENGWTVPGGQKYFCDEYTIDGDWSQAAFFLVGGAVGGDVSMHGLNINSVQGDKAIFDIIRKFGGNISYECGVVRSISGELSAIDVNAADIPDLVPAIAVLAANAKGTAKIYGAERLRLKESDRIKTVISALRAFGVSVTEQPDGMIIEGKRDISSVTPVDSANDHRIAMAFSVMGAYSKNGCVIEGERCVDKSYPSFFDDLAALQED